MRTLRTHFRPRSILSVRGLQACATCLKVIHDNMSFERTKDMRPDTVLCIVPPQLQEFVLPPEKPLERPRAKVAKRARELDDGHPVALSGNP